MEYKVTSNGLDSYVQAVTENNLLAFLRLQRPLEDYCKESQVLPWIRLYGYDKKDLKQWIESGKVNKRRVKNADKFSRVEISNQLVNLMKQRYIIPVYNF